MYKARLNVDGQTQRERLINGFNRQIQSNGAGSISYKSVKIDNVSCNLFIDSTSDPYVKTFADVNGSITGAGKIVEWQDQNWLVVSYDFDKEIYADGKLRFCNYTLKLLSSSGQAISRPCCIQSPTNAGVTQEGQISVGKSQYTILLPYDTETALLDKTYPDGQTRRLLIDYGTSVPYAYKITHADRVSYPGCIELYIDEVERSTDDNVTLMIADYTSRVSPTPVPPSEDGSCEISYSGDAVLEVGKGLKTFTAIFYDETGTIDSTKVPSWNIVLADASLLSKVIRETQGNYIKLKVTDKSMIGTQIKLELKDTDNTVSTFIILEVSVIG